MIEQQIQYKELCGAGYIQSTYPVEQLTPVRDEIEKIKQNNFNAKKANSNLAGNIEKEFELVESKKYLNWTYQGKDYYMGELMILSGKRTSTTDAGHEGWNLSKPGTTQQEGGITFCNPHTDIKIRLEILIGR